MRMVTENTNSAIRSGTDEVPHRTFHGFTPSLEVRKGEPVAQWARENFPAVSRYHSASFLSSSHCPNLAADSYFARTDWHHDGRSGQDDHAVVFGMASRRGAAVAHVSPYGNLERQQLHESGSN